MLGILCACGLLVRAIAEVIEILVKLDSLLAGSIQEGHYIRAYNHIRPVCIRSSLMLALRTHTI